MAALLILLAAVGYTSWAVALAATASAVVAVAVTLFVVLRSERRKPVPAAEPVS